MQAYKNAWKIKFLVSTFWFVYIFVKDFLYIYYCVFSADGHIKKFLAETKSMSPAEKATYLESNKVTLKRNV